MTFPYTLSFEKRPSRIYSGIIFSIIRSGLWLASFPVIRSIRNSWSHRRKENSLLLSSSSYERRGASLYSLSLLLCTDEATTRRASQVFTLSCSSSSLLLLYLDSGPIAFNYCSFSPAPFAHGKERRPFSPPPVWWKIWLGCNLVILLGSRFYGSNVSFFNFWWFNFVYCPRNFINSS